MNLIRQANRVRVVCVLMLAAALFAPQRAEAQAAGADDRRIQLLQAKPRAYAVVESTANHPQARVRLAGLEAAQHAPDAAFDLARSGLVDSNPAVRFAALVTIGKLKLDRLADAAVDLMRDEDASVRAAAIYAAKRCGRDVDLSPLGGMLASGDPATRANAAMLVGQLGDPQAIDMLEDMAARPMPRVSTAQRAWVRLQFAEAMVRLDPDNLEVLGTLRAAVFANLDDVRILAIQVLGEIGDRSVQGGLGAIIEKENPLQVKIAAARALLQLGDNRGVAMLMQAAEYDSRALRRDLEKYLRAAGDDSPEGQAIRALLENEQQREFAAAEVRAQAAVALSWVKSEAAVERLTQLMDDPSPIVQVAAASAVLRASR